jgi:Transmembrane secretion effector
MNLWLAVAAASLAVLCSLGLLNPYLVLLCVFLLGIGFAFTAPVWPARMNATFFVVTQGAMVLGGIIWGTATTIYGPNRTLIGAAIVLIISLIAAIPPSIDFTKTLDLSVVPVTGFSHKILYIPKADDGPVVIHYDIEVDRARGGEFLETHSLGTCRQSDRPEDGQTHDY